MMPPSKSRSIPVPQPAHQQLIIAPWRAWESVAVNLTNVTAEVRTLDLWRAFKDEGNVRSIDIFEDSHGNRTTRAKIRSR
jgi:RNA-dependent RNA polymerase